MAPPGRVAHVALVVLAAGCGSGSPRGDTLVVNKVAQPPLFDVERCDCLAYPSDPPGCDALLDAWSKRVFPRMNTLPSEVGDCLAALDTALSQTVAALGPGLECVRRERDVTMAIAIEERMKRLGAAQLKTQEQRAGPEREGPNPNWGCLSLAENAAPLVEQGFTRRCGCFSWFDEPGVEVAIEHMVQEGAPWRLLRLRDSIDGRVVLTQYPPTGPSLPGLVPAGEHVLVTEMDVGRASVTGGGPNFELKLSHPFELRHEQRGVRIRITIASGEGSEERPTARVSSEEAR